VRKLVEAVNDELGVPKKPALAHVAVDGQVARIVVYHNTGGCGPPCPQQLKHAPGGLELVHGVEAHYILAVQADASHDTRGPGSVGVRVLRARGVGNVALRLALVAGKVPDHRQPWVVVGSQHEPVILGLHPSRHNLAPCLLAAVVDRICVLGYSD